MTETVSVIGAGLAGCEAAWQLAKFGHSVTLYEMKPKNFHQLIGPKILLSLFVRIP